MKKLLIILAVLAVIAAGLLGYLAFQITHIFVEGTPYPKNAQTLDLLEDEISLEHYTALQAQLPGCVITWNVPIQDGTAPSNTGELTLQGLSQQDLDRMRYFTALKTVTVTDCDDYALLEQLQTQLPQAKVEYTVNLGSVEVDHFAETLTLESGEYDIVTLIGNLHHIPGVTRVHFPKADLTADELAQLREAYPEVEFTCTVILLGQELDGGTTELDLSAMTGDQVEQAAAQLSLLEELDSVQLSNDLTMEQVKVLKDANPDVNFRYSFELLGQTFTTDDEIILFKNNWKLKDDVIPQLRLALDIMNDCKKLVMDNTGVTSGPMSQLREDYRGKTEIVWRVFFGEGGSSLTDVEVLRVVYGLMDDNSENLKYLEKVRYMDLGHNEFLDYCDFVAHMPELEVVIISGAPIKTLEPFKNCTKLKFLEMANCLYVPDLEPLRNCKELEMLNIAHTKISDLSPIEELPLTHLCTKANKVEEEARLLYEETHPDCWVSYQGQVDYTTGWRYNEDGSKTLWYDKLSNAFGYPTPNNNTGWYLK